MLKMEVIQGYNTQLFPESLIPEVPETQWIEPAD